MSTNDIRDCIGDMIRKAPRVCFFAHYHPHGIVAPHVLAYLAALQKEGFSTVVLSTADLSESEKEKFTPFCAAVIMRANSGLDFGGWIEAFARFSPLEAEFLLLANDSVYAPIGDFPTFFAKLTSVDADFYGAVESLEHQRHLQSWFVLLRPDAYRSDAFRRLMLTPIPADMPKHQIITDYEIGLTVKLNKAGLRHHAFYSPRRSGWLARNRPFNACQMIWRQLVEDGLPFIKVDLLRDNPVRAPDIEQWREVVSAHAPSMVPLIADDIERRRTFTDEERGSKERWYWSLYVAQAVCWPEARNLVVRDHRASKGFRAMADRALFSLIELLGFNLRPRIRHIVESRNATRERGRLNQARRPSDTEG